MLEEDFGSDTDDSDYTPQGEGHDASEEEGSGIDEKTIHGEDDHNKSSKKKRKVKKKSNSLFSRTPAEDTSKDWQKFDEEIKKEVNEKQEQERIESLWSSFKSDVDVKTAVTAKPTLCDNKSIKENKPVASPSSSVSTTKSSSSSSRFGSLFDPSPAATETKSDPPNATSKPKSRFGSLFDDDVKKDDPSDKNIDSSKPDIASASDKVSVTKVYDFAGETVKVTKEVAADSKEAKQFLEKAATTGEEASREAANKRKVGGLASVVGSIGKKAKMGCLDKSQLDWNQFVQDEGIKEELSTHNRGKEGFVEKQMFLERADQRQFEIERAIREKNRKTLMK